MLLNFRSDTSILVLNKWMRHYFDIHLFKRVMITDSIVLNINTNMFYLDQVLWLQVF